MFSCAVRYIHTAVGVVRVIYVNVRTVGMAGFNS